MRWVSGEVGVKWGRCQAGWMSGGVGEVGAR